jgi:hypothetical protein
MPRSSYFPNTICWRVHIMEILIMQFSSVSCSLIPCPYVVFQNRRDAIIIRIENLQLKLISHWKVYARVKRATACQ